MKNLILILGLFLLISSCMTTKTFPLDDYDKKYLGTAGPDGSFIYYAEMKEAIENIASKYNRLDYEAVFMDEQIMVRARQRRITKLTHFLIEVKKKTVKTN
jgi:hypothetical protein